jgi:DNA-binding MarR family transcriptional regulator
MYNPLTMGRAAQTGHEKRTLLELLLQLEGDIRRRLKPIRVTPLQAGVLLFLRRHAIVTLTDAATTLSVRLTTLSGIVKNLVHKRWVIKRYSVKDRRVVHLRLSRRGLVIARKIENQIRRV